MLDVVPFRARNGPFRSRNAPFFARDAPFSARNAAFRVRDPPFLPEVRHLVQFGTSSTHAGGQDDVSSNQLPQHVLDITRSNLFQSMTLGSISGSV